MKILVTGSAGHLGEALMRALPDAGHEPVGLDVLPSAYTQRVGSIVDRAWLFHHRAGLACVVLRTSRFFPEQDDRKEVREAYDDANLKLNELLHRRVDLEDVVSAHVLALARASTLGFARYIVSATTPFTRDDLAELARDAPSVTARRVPVYLDAYAKRGWTMFRASTASTSTSARGASSAGLHTSISRRHWSACASGRTSAAHSRSRSARRATTRSASPRDPIRSNEPACQARLFSTFCRVSSSRLRPRSAAFLRSSSRERGGPCDSSAARSSRVTS